MRNKGKYLKPKSRFPDEREHINSEMASYEGLEAVGNALSAGKRLTMAEILVDEPRPGVATVVTYPMSGWPCVNYISIESGAKDAPAEKPKIEKIQTEREWDAESIDQAIKRCLDTFDFPKEYRQALKKELRNADITRELAAGILAYFKTGKEPHTFSVKKDPVMGQTYFVKGEVINYLEKNFENLDISDPLTAILAIMDNPNIKVQELFLGKVAVATLDILLSGKGPDKNLTYAFHREGGSHNPEHSATRYGE